MVITVSNIRRMLESFEVEGGGTATVVGSINALSIVSLVEERGGGATPEDDSTIEHLELALI